MEFGHLVVHDGATEGSSVALILLPSRIRYPLWPMTEVFPTGAVAAPAERI